MSYRQRHPYLMQIVYIVRAKIRELFHSKSIPQKVIQLPFTINGRELSGWHCPRCRRYLWTSKDTSTHYCPNCGQRLDWR